ncbi:MAG: ferredoxin [Acidobacteriota bacterium]
MTLTAVAPQVASLLTSRTRLAWRVVQSAVWLVGAGMVAALLWAPEIGIHAFWNFLIPVAPALLAIAPGLWRNICPLASTALFARHIDRSSRLKVPCQWQGRLLFIGVVLLFLIIPLRHILLDLSGPATALVILLLAVAAIFMGSRFEWKSGWCSGMCPVHGVEKLYGTVPFFSPPNAHCTLCERCVQPCADSTPGLHPLMVENGLPRLLAGILMVGAFPGFIWGWFQVPDYLGDEGWRHLGAAYGYPLLGAATTLLVLLVLRPRISGRHRSILYRAFAAAAIACYYWYRLPALFGFGPFPGDGMLVDLRATLPAWFPAISRSATTLLFTWWLVGRRSVPRTWLVRPPFAQAA